MALPIPQHTHPFSAAQALPAASRHPTIPRAVLADPHTNRRRSSIAGATRMPSGVR
jgi:hypothetical protein